MPNRSQIIEEYDVLYRRGDLIRANSSHKFMLNQIPLIQEHGCVSIFEIGCGTGIVTRALKNCGFDVVGTECIPYLLNGVLRNLRVYPYMAHELDEIPSVSFDLVISVNVFDHLIPEDVDKGLQAAFRIARLGVLTVINGDPILQTIKENAQWWVKRFSSHYRHPEFTTHRRGGLLLSCWFF